MRAQPVQDVNPVLSQPCPEQCQVIPALPWAGKLLAASQRGRWEGSWEEYLIQLEDRSETAATEREQHQHWVTAAQAAEEDTESIPAE